MIQNLSQLGYKIESKKDLKKYVPSIYTKEAHPERTDKYSFVSTDSLLNGFNKNGWEVTHAKQNGLSTYSRHIIRMENSSLGFIKVKNDKIKPQIILDNSHNGSSLCQIHMGLFRLVCTNGLVVAVPGLGNSLKIKHIGVDSEEIKKLLFETSEQYKLIGDNVSDMSKIELNQDEKEEFAIRAYAEREYFRLIDKNGKIDIKGVTKEINPKELVEPIRLEDKKDDLWSTFNIVQEHLVKGEYNKTSPTGRKSTPRPLINAVRNLHFNKAIWTAAEEVMLEKQ
jgi:hypothetical protein